MMSALPTRRGAGTCVMCVSRFISSGEFAGVVGDATAHDGEVAEDGGQFVIRAFERVDRRNAEVGVEAGSQLAAVSLLPGEPGSIPRVGGDSVPNSHPVALRADAGTVECASGHQPPDR